MGNTVCSYADPVTGAIRLQLKEEIAEVTELISKYESDITNKAFKLGIIQWAWKNHYETMIHEWAHIFQICCYPYLYLRAVRHARRATSIPTWLRKNPGEYNLPIKIGFENNWEASHYLGTIPYEIIIDEKSISYQYSSDGLFRKNIITEHDLIEEDAMIFQYKVMIGTPGSGKSYRYWLEEKLSYSRVFNLLTRIFDNEVAYLLLPILTRISFQTTRPIEAFVECIAILKGDESIIPQSHEDDLTESILGHLIEDRFGIFDLDSSSLSSPEISDKKGYFPIGQIIELADKFNHLPISPLVKASATELTDKSFFLSKILSEPWLFFDRKTRAYAPELEKYMPPAITITPLCKQYKIGWTVIVFSALLVQSESPIPNISYADYCQALIQEKDAWQPLLDNQTSSLNPHCPHSNCKIYETGLCRGWKHIPTSSEKCEFPKFFEEGTLHKILNNKIIPLS